MYTMLCRPLRLETVTEREPEPADIRVGQVRDRVRRVIGEDSDGGGGGVGGDADSDHRYDVFRVFRVQVSKLDKSLVDSLLDERFPARGSSQNPSGAFSPRD